LQTHPGEDEDTAWRRLRPKLSLTGRHLDDVFVMRPSAVPATGGSAPATAVPTPTPAGGDLLGGGATSTPGIAEPASGDSPVPAPAPSGIFGGGAAARRRTALSNPATSPLNLIGKIEGWGIGPATRLDEVSIKVSTATGAQLRELLKKLPEGMTFELNLEKEDD
jgi:hypothetical protein